MLATQPLLVVMAMAWCVQLALKAVWGETRFTQTNAGIQYGQNAAAVLVVMLAVLVLAIRHGRVTEKRNRYSRRDRPWDPQRLQILDPR